MLGAGLVFAGQADTDFAEVVVVGKRASLATAQDIKRDKLEIVDSVVADEINKLPDINVTDALSRVSGVQILRDRGEGAGVAIRGLTQMETWFNGREVFTAGNGRNLDFADIPAEMLAGLDVYKTSSANQIEGGVGGVIDLRTHRPFDFEGRQFAASARYLRRPGRRRQTAAVGAGQPTLANPGLGRIRRTGQPGLAATGVARGSG